jgi:hypothetical protein
MRRRTIRMSAAALASAALLAVAGCGGGSASTSTTSASAQGTQQQGRPGGPFSQANVSALAKDLGVTTTQLQKALSAARPAGAPNGTPPSGGQQGSGSPPAGARGPGGGQLAANLAKQLNLPVAKVQTALAKVLPGRGGGAAPPASSSGSTQS